MKPFSPPVCRRLPLGGAAFTLIELLVVISIIAVLAGLLLPVVSKVIENARRVSAKSTETQVVAAVNNYQTDYGQYPVVVTAGNTSDTPFGTDGHNHLLFDALRAIKTNGPTDALNARQIVYYEGKNVKNNTVPKDGFILIVGGKSAKNGTAFQIGDLVDPWGNAYLARIDTNYNNVVTNPYSDKPGTGSDDPTTTNATILRLGSICYSYGLDGAPGINGTSPSTPYTSIGDDVVSWQ